MTDPTADAAKLLPCPSVICPSHHPAWDAGIVAGLRDETSGYRVTCAECDASTGYYAHAGEAIAAWNTRPQPAPPEGEPDFEERRAMFIDFCALHKFGMNGWPRACLDQFNTIMRQMYRLGLAARPKVEDVDVLRSQLAEITVDRDEWKQQHENLVSVRETDIANLAAKIDGLKAELDRRKGDPRTRLHNLCEALQEDLDKSPYTREEWEQVDREIVELQRKLREAEAKLAEREAELGQARNLILFHVDPMDIAPQYQTAYDAARQQQNG